MKGDIRCCMTFEVAIKADWPKDRNLAIELWFFEPGSLGQQPQDIFLKSNFVRSKFIVHHECLKEPVAQCWVVTGL